MNDAPLPMPVDGMETFQSQPSLVAWLVAPLDPAPGSRLPPLRYWTLARELAARGHRVVWWTPSFDDGSLEQRDGPTSLEGLESFELRTIQVPAYRGRFSRRRFASHRAFASRFEDEAMAAIAGGTLDRPDVVIASLPPLESAESASRLSRKLDTTIVIDLTENWPDRELACVGNSWIRRLFFACAAATFKGITVESLRRRRGVLLDAADAVVATSAAVAEVSTGRADVKIFPVGAFPQEFVLRKRELSEGGNGSNSGEDIVVGSPRNPSISIVVPADCLTDAEMDCLADASRQLSRESFQACFQIVGRNPARRHLERAAGMQMGNACRMTPVRICGRHEWLSIVGSADAAIVFGPVHEPFAITVETCECLAAGLPVICAADEAGGQLADLVERHGGGVCFQRGDHRSLADAIRRLARETARRSSAAVTARRLAEREFDRERICSAYADWLESLA